MKRSYLTQCKCSEKLFSDVVRAKRILEGQIKLVARYGLVTACVCINLLLMYRLASAALQLPALAVHVHLKANNHTVKGLQTLCQKTASAESTM